MKHVAALLLIVIGFGGFIATQSLPAIASDHHAALLVIDGAIDPVSARFLSRGVDAAIESDARLLIIRLDTPGGLLSSTRDMVTKLLTSDIPIVVYVSPPGAQAASAGTFITAAAHIAAMAPGTNIGAASPVGSGGEDLPDTLKSKATQDTAAFMRSIAEERGRNSEKLEQTVLNAVSFSASEALTENIIDLIAEDMEDLLAQLDGMTVSLASGEIALETDGLDVREIEKTPVERFIGILADPNIAFLLLSLGGIGIMIELFSPGLIFPGVAGAIALALAFVAIGNLPVNWAGVGLLGLAILLFYFEAQAPGLGVFVVGGAISFVLGAFLLFGGFSPPPIYSPSFQVSLWVIGAFSAVLFGAMAFFLRTLRQAKNVPYLAGLQTLVGQTGTTTTALDPRGTIQIASEQWSAVSDSGEPIPPDEEVIVADIEGLILKVFKTPKGM